MTSKNDQDECQPLKTLESLLSWEATPFDWSSKVIRLTPRGFYRYAGNSYECDGIIRKPVKLLANAVPKTIVCHDMKGGYLDDRFVHGANFNNQYVFYSWPLIDTFIYFSHYFVTIPPLMWINAAHKNGVEILGTIITESTDGRVIWDRVLANDEILNAFTTKLCDLCHHFGFDGYFLNIENRINVEQLPRLISFMKNFKKLLGSKKLIWYDSVSMIDGQLDWQNELNKHNKEAFQICDGIFLNYNWTTTNLKNSAINAGNRQFDVYVGIDVFGRGTLGGGGFNCDVAFKAIKPFALSVALFAQGWTHEKNNPENHDHFLSIEKTFWNKIIPFLYLWVPNQLPFETDFNEGITNKSKITKEPSLIYNLSFQSFIVSSMMGSYAKLTDYCKCWMPKIHLGDSCLQLKKNTAAENDVYNLLLCDFLSSLEKPILFSIIAKTVDNNINEFHIIILVEEDGTEKNYTVILKFSENPLDKINEHEIYNYSCCLTSSNVINGSKIVSSLDNGWIKNGFTLNLNGRINGIEIQSEHALVIKLLKFEYRR